VDVGMIIDDRHEHPAAMVVLAAFLAGWPGRDPERPGVDINALAVRDLFDDPNLTEYERDQLTRRYAGLAEGWLNSNASLPGHKFGWHDEEFWFQTDEWWKEQGGPDSWPVHA